MIALEEKLIPLKNVADIVPSNVQGKRIAYATLWRWSIRGVNGVVLETLRTPGGRVTSKEAVHRFLSQLTVMKNGSQVCVSRASLKGKETATKRMVKDGIWQGADSGPKQKIKGEPS